MPGRPLKDFDCEHRHLLQAAGALYGPLSALASSIPSGLEPSLVAQAVVVESYRSVAHDPVASVGEVLTSREA